METKIQAGCAGGAEVRIRGQRSVKNVLFVSLEPGSGPGSVCLNRYFVNFCVSCGKWSWFSKVWTEEPTPAGGHPSVGGDFPRVGTAALPQLMELFFVRFRG